MTLREAKTKVYALLDAHSVDGAVEHDPDIEKKMTFFFDIAQKELAKIRKILRIYPVPRTEDEEEYPMPADFCTLKTVRVDGRPARTHYRWNGRSIFIPHFDRARRIEVEYYAMPATIGEDAPDSYEFELAEDACNCLPYYVAAQNLLPDLVIDHTPYLQMWNLSVSTLSPEVPGDWGELKQTLFK